MSRADYKRYILVGSLLVFAGLVLIPLGLIYGKLGGCILLSLFSCIAVFGARHVSVGVKGLLDEKRGATLERWDRIATIIIWVIWGGCMMLLLYHIFDLY
jgi:hypothetical protein